MGRVRVKEREEIENGRMKEIRRESEIGSHSKREREREKEIERN